MSEAKPEQGEGVDELAQQGWVLLLFGEDGCFCGEALGTPESACGPVCEGPRDAQLPYQGKYVVILHNREQLV